MTHRRTRWTSAPLLVMASDVVIILACLLISAQLRGALGFFDTDGTRLSVPVGVAGGILGGWLLLLTASGSYQQRVLGAGYEEYRAVINASLGCAGVVGIVCYLLKYELSRGFYVILFAIGTMLLLFGRRVGRILIHKARRRGHLLQRVVLVGNPTSVDEIAAVLERESWLGYDVVGALTPSKDLAVETGRGITVWGNTDDLSWVLEHVNADTVFVASGAFRSSSEMRQAVWDLEERAIQVVVAPNVTDVAPERVRMRPVGGLPLVHLDLPRAAGALRWGKRAFDIVGSSVLIAVFAALMALAAMRVRSFDGGPVLFRQTRVGMNGQTFSCLKFRTMVTDAEALLAKLHDESGYAGGLFKMTDDPRITKPGRWLRRYSIDELPQLFNVLRGDMSLVGPRPPLPHEVAAYADHMHRRLRVRPGMTGLWQVSGRSNLTFEEAIRLDLYYVDNWSMASDLGILWRTFGAVFGSRGAY